MSYSAKLIVKTCPICGHRFARMKKYRVRGGGYVLRWHLTVVYCSRACQQEAYRRRKQKRPAFPHKIPSQN